MNIDKMNEQDRAKYWRDKDGTDLSASGKTGSEFNRCSAIVRAFLNNPQNQDLMRTWRSGMAIKAAIAVSEGMTLTRDLWSSLFGHGPEHQPSIRSQ